MQGCAMVARAAIIGVPFAVGCWLWPAGFLFGPLGTITPKTVWLAVGSMALFAVAGMTLLFVALEPAAALVRRVRWLVRIDAQVDR
jgi:hypothetical protein